MAGKSNTGLTVAISLVVVVFFLVGLYFLTRKKANPAGDSTPAGAGNVGNPGGTGSGAGASGTGTTGNISSGQGNTASSEANSNTFYSFLANIGLLPPLNQAQVPASQQPSDTGVNANIDPAFQSDPYFNPDNYAGNEGTDYSSNAINEVFL